MYSDIDNRKLADYINSPMNYTGSKFKLLKQILPLFPSDIDTFVDVFAGGLSVSLNTNADKCIINDNNKDIINLYGFFKRNDIDDIIAGIEMIISKYNLSDTSKNGYEHYGLSSAVGLKSYNKEAYIRLRTDYNNHVFEGDINFIVFYVLIIFGFNNQIRFNRKGKFNIPVGKRDFNCRMRDKLINFIDRFQEMDIELLNLDFRDLLDNINNTDNLFIYLDPPYLISTAGYNENGGWSLKDELDMYERLDILNSKGIKFALSNVTEHKGFEATDLIEWSKNYKVHNLNYNYNNSNYQSKAKLSKTTEVLITNY